MTKAKRILLAEDEVALRDFVSRNLKATRSLPSISARMIT